MYKFLLSALMLLAACSEANKKGESDLSDEVKSTDNFLWENATVYFLLTDRFNNGNPDNDISFERTDETAVLRGFMGGDIAGITRKINDGYFSELGVTAIWLTPPVEQIHGSVDEGTGVTYGYHGYWTRDWTSLDPNFGTGADLLELVKTAHQHGIRIVLDVVLNHTGPVTDIDPVWPEEWVRTGPACTYVDAASTIECTLVENLPDIRTESEQEVELPEFLVNKWKEEGRYEQETAELEEFFAATGFPRAPKYYIMKWLRDFILEYGVDGFRVDTAKHTEPDVWGDLYSLAAEAFEQWKAGHPNEIPGDKPFYMVGEVYYYSIGHGRSYPMGGEDFTDFFAEDFTALINFALKHDVRRNLDSTYAAYSDVLNSGPLKGFSVLNYMSSHDDGQPFDPLREQPKRTGTLLMLAPGAAQIYYGDELARPLTYPGAEGDANLRTYMNWEDLENGSASEVFEHWAKLGRFRRDHPAIGAGIHAKISDTPYTFSRIYTNDEISDKVVVALDASGDISVGEVFTEGETVRDAYSGTAYTVKNGLVHVGEQHEVVLIEGVK